MAISAPPPAGAPQGNQLQLEKDLYYPDSLGDLYSRVTELLGFNAGSDEHKVQWLSSADSGEQFLPLFDEILGSSDWPCINRSFFDSDRLSQGGFSEKFYSRLGIEDGAEIPANAPCAASRRTAARHRKRGAAHGRTRRKSYAWRAAWA